MVASELASELGMRQVLVPPHPGNLSALGLLFSPLKRDFVRTRIGRLADLNLRSLLDAYAELEARATREFEADGLGESALVFHRSVDLRYVGQSFTLNLPIANDSLDRLSLQDDFHATHDRTFAHAAPGEPVELVNLRVAALLPCAELSVRFAPGQRAEPPPRDKRRVFFAGQFISCPVYDRADLPSELELSGPLVVDEPGSSTIVWPRDKLRVDKLGNLRVEVGEK